MQKIIRHFRRVDPKIYQVLSGTNLSEWFDVHSPSEYYRQLTRNIIFQQLSGSAADTIYRRFEKSVGEVTPQRVVSASSDALRAAGLSYAKIKYVQDLASKVLSGGVALESLDNLDDESVITHLTKVKGIGRWTAEMFLIFSLHRPDVFSYLDLGLKKGLAKLYGLNDPSEEDIKNIITPWSPYKTYGSIALWHHLDNR